MKECLNTNRLSSIATRVYPISVRGKCSEDIAIGKFTYKKGEVYFFTPRPRLKNMGSKALKDKSRRRYIPISYYDKDLKEW